MEKNCYGSTIPVHSKNIALSPCRFIFPFLKTKMFQSYKRQKSHESSSFKFTFRYTDGVVTSNGSRLYILHGRNQDTTETASSSKFKTYLSSFTTVVTQGIDYWIREKIKVKINIFPYMCSNIHTSGCSSFISHLIGHARADYLKKK